MFCSITQKSSFAQSLACLAMQILVVLLFVEALSSRLDYAVMSNASSTLPKLDQRCSEKCATTPWHQQKDCCGTGLVCSKISESDDYGLCGLGLGALCNENKWWKKSYYCGDNFEGPTMECPWKKKGKSYCCIPDEDFFSCGSGGHILDNWTAIKHSPPNGDAELCCSKKSHYYWSQDVGGVTLCGPKCVF